MSHEDLVRHAAHVSKVVPRLLQRYGRRQTIERIAALALAVPAVVADLQAARAKVDELATLAQELAADNHTLRNQLAACYLKRDQLQRYIDSLQGAGLGEHLQETRKP
jgi:outer membrane murein-binding lipoprotein Lpp